MKLFKGEMSLWAQLTDEKKMNGPGGFTDTSTYRAAVAGVILGAGMYFFFWNLVGMSGNFDDWLHHPALWLHWSPPWHEPSGAIRKYHFYALIWLFVGVGSGFVSFLGVWLTRRRARKSAQGQWYDRPDLTKEDLYGKPRGANKTNQDTP